VAFTRGAPVFCSLIKTSGSAVERRKNIDSAQTVQPLQQQRHGSQQEARSQLSQPKSHESQPGASQCDRSEQLLFLREWFDGNIERKSRNWWNKDGEDRQAGTPQDGSPRQSAANPQVGSQPQAVSQDASQPHVASQDDSQPQDASQPQVAVVSKVVSQQVAGGAFLATKSSISSKLKRLSSFACASGPYKNRNAKPTVSWLANFLIVLSPVRERQPVSAVKDVKWDGP